jgi:hypothetical protein
MRVLTVDPCAVEARLPSFSRAGAATGALRLPWIRSSREVRDAILGEAATPGVDHTSPNAFARSAR